MISVHVETSPHLHRTLGALRSLGVRAGVGAETRRPRPACSRRVADQLDYVVVMSVNPGFAGQAFIPASVGEGASGAAAARPRRATPRPWRSTGEYTPGTSAQVVEAGADIVVAASAIFGADDAAAATRALREAARPATLAVPDRG